MTLDLEADVFPNNFIYLVSERFKLIDPMFAKAVFRRPLRKSDPNHSIGVFATTWSPEQDSVEMGGLKPAGSRDATLQDYNVVIQSFVKDMDEVRGLAHHGVIAKSLRGTLARDVPLGVALQTLNSSVGGPLEVLASWRIGTQRYYTNELDGSWLYMSTLDVQIQTQTI